MSDTHDSGMYAPQSTSRLMSVHLSALTMLERTSKIGPVGSFAASSRTGSQRLIRIRIVSKTRETNVTKRCLHFASA